MCFFSEGRRRKRQITDLSMSGTEDGGFLFISSTSWTTWSDWDLLFQLEKIPDLNNILRYSFILHQHHGVVIRA